ncbi:MAG TPA: hypothetical protein VG755_21525 [Nannocystaceae bacterium]|nr:hypothetical protein [Nannocystaceae bacterium]
MRHHLLPVLAAASAVLSPAVALAVRPPIVLADARIEAIEDATELEARGGKSVRVKGEDTAVRIVPLAQGDRSLSFGVRHVDDGDHRFEIGFGDSVEIACNEVSISCNEHAGSATITPKLVDAQTYSIRVEHNGKLVTDEHGRAGAFTIDDFEGGLEQRKTETLVVTLAYGAVRADAWTLVVTHEDFTIAITPDVAQKFVGLPTVGLRTKGLGQIDLTGIKTRAKS